MGGARALGCIGLAAGVICALAALATGSEAPAPSAIAHALPAHYRLVLTEASDHGRLHVASYGRRTSGDPFDAPLRVESFRGSDKPVGSLVAGDGDRETTVRGHPALERTLTDEGRAYARELVWRERPDLAIAVSANFVVSKRALRRVAEDVRIVGQRAWARLYRQTSGAAQIGHPTRKMRRERVERGVASGRRWTLLALIPPHFPLSRDDRRASCFELRFRGGRGHGDNCGLTANWQRI